MPRPVAFLIRKDLWVRLINFFIGNLETIPMSSLAQREAAFAYIIDVCEEADDPEAYLAETMPYEFLELLTRKAGELLPVGHAYSVKLWLLREVVLHP